MRRLGVHTSIAGGVHFSLNRAHKLGCSTVQIFSHNPRSWELKELSSEDIALFREMRERYDISPVYIHTSYLINLASANRGLRERSVRMLMAELDRADMIGADYVVLHPGCAAGDYESAARARAIAALNKVADGGSWNAELLIENTAGKRGDISSSIEELREIIEGVPRHLIAGICLDSCHAFAAGYDIRQEDVLHGLSAAIQQFIGKDRLRLIHLNDSKKQPGSRVDRHEHIGQGRIGMRGLQAFICHELFRDVPLILETPKKSESDDPMNLARVRKLIGTHS
jgi:deoxyribonuclease-4